MRKNPRMLVGILVTVVVVCAIALYFINRNEVNTCVKMIPVERDGYQKADRDLSAEFTELKAVDAVNLNEIKTIGYLRDRQAGKLDIFQYLLQSGNLRTGVNLGSYNCIERDAIGSLRYDNYTVKTTYPICTNKCYEEKYEFTFMIDRETGEVTVLPLRNGIP